MKVEILEFVEGARHAQGVTVIIDVYSEHSPLPVMLQMRALQE